MAARDERVTNTPASHHLTEKKTACPPPSAPNRLTGQSGVPENLFDFYVQSVSAPVGSGQSPSGAPVTMNQVKEMIQDLLREAMGSVVRPRGTMSLWDMLVASNHALPSPSHRPTPPSSPVEERPSPVAETLPSLLDGSEPLSNNSTDPRFDLMPPLRPPFAASYTIDQPCNPTALFSERSESALKRPLPVDDDMAPHLSERLVTALEKLVAANGVQNTAPDREKGEINSDGEPEGTKAAPASILEYKHVDEVWDDKAGKYKLVESADSRGDKLDQYVFVVRDRIDRITQTTTSYVDIKSIWLREVLREVCRDIRGVSFASSKLLV
ncbi:hypothetical protein DL769_006464 [Monosporascus sp. CRB-8-3]|nr:hypothetical protein DL769_006464 [Monosporascus sp. CRB-8-3]